jgi:hypothetical protein
MACAICAGFMKPSIFKLPRRAILPLPLAEALPLTAVG